MTEKVVLAYSGGLDTSVAIHWIKERYRMDVVALTIDVGANKSLEEARTRALQAGAINAYIVDARRAFLEDFAFPTLQAGAIYQGQYPLATALSRPLISQLLVKVARQEGATAVAHGCTGKGNDQVRFDVSVGALAPDLKIIAPAREWNMSRDEETEYARKHRIPLGASSGSPYSTDENLWGRSIECGPLEDPWVEPPEEVFAWTKSIRQAPDQPTYVEVAFEDGIPVAVDGERMEPVALVGHLHELAGRHGIGRIDHIEDRVVGIKSREVYEAPAATLLLAAHRALENMTLSRDEQDFKANVSREYARLVYDGLWFSALRRDLEAFVRSSQRFVTGEVRVRLHKGTCVPVGRRSRYSLYSHDLATYDKGDAFDHKASEGFIRIWGLPVRSQARAQGTEEKGTSE